MLYTGQWSSPVSLFVNITNGQAFPVCSDGTSGMETGGQVVQVALLVLSIKSLGLNTQ